VQLILTFIIAVLPVCLYFGPSVRILIITKDNSIATEVILKTQKHDFMSMMSPAVGGEVALM
jgi:hypothetical protein